MSRFKRHVVLAAGCAAVLTWLGAGAARAERRPPNGSDAAMLEARVREDIERRIVPLLEQMAPGQAELKYVDVRVTRPTALPPGAAPWTCGCQLEPRRTNTGRRPYSGNPYRYEMRRHHLVFAVDRNGNTIEEWLQHDRYLAPPRGTGLGEVARGPHKLLQNPYDPAKHIWIVDDDMHEINIFTNDGKLVKTMGERGVPGRGPNNFNRPTDIAWLPDGTFFVADGYAGTRVAKFDKNGKFLLDWGKPPVDPKNPQPGEFWSVHSIGISNDRRIFVADREHHRMQVYDENGKFLYLFPTGYDSAVLAHIVTDDDYVWVADWTTDRLVKYTLDGRYVLDIGSHGPLPGQFDGVHQIDVDQEGNLYVTEVANDRSQMFRPKKGANPAWIIRPMVGRKSNTPKPVIPKV